MNDSRKISLDILRIIAAFSVVMLHVYGNLIYRYPVGTFNFNGANFIDSLNRFGVPIFVMISGALFLDKSRKSDVKRLWLHNILRLAVIYVLWSVIYYLFATDAGPKAVLEGKTLAQNIEGILHADSYLWFFLMLMVVYALSPVLKKWTEGASRKDVEYYLILFIVFNVVMETVVTLADSYTVSEIARKLYLGSFIGYLGYFVLGYYFANYEISAKMRKFLYISVPFDIALNYLSSRYMTQKTGAYHPGVYDSFGLFTLLETAALFLFVTSTFGKVNSAGTGTKILQSISKDTLGVYLLHELFINKTEIFRTIVYGRFPLLWAVVYAIALFIITALISEVLRRLPFAGKYIC